MPVNIFFCYAHEDEPLLNKLKAHLRPLQRLGLIEAWHDRDISAGADWEQEIRRQLDSAQIILLLVSPDFMDSDFCYTVEMKRALERDKSGEAVVIPIILRPVYWQGAPFSKLQALPTDAQPITSPKWHNQDDAFFNIAEGIRKVVEELTPKSRANVSEPSLALPTKVNPLLEATPVPSTFPTTKQRTILEFVRGKSFKNNPFTLISLFIVLTVLVSLLVWRLLASASVGSNSSSPGIISPPATPATIVNSLPGCPSAETAHSAVMSPLRLSNHQNIVYIETTPNPPSSTLLRYDVTAGSNYGIVKISNIFLRNAQLSKDGQWVFFIADDAGQSKLELMRMDGRMLQTLYCALPPKIIGDAQWSSDQKWLIFNEYGNVNMGGTGETVYLLNVANGVLQPEMSFPPSETLNYVPLHWLDQTQIYIKATPYGGACPCIFSLLLLNINNGTYQKPPNLKRLIDNVDPANMSVDNSIDGRLLFTSQCFGTAQFASYTPPCSITARPISGGNAKTIFNSPTLYLRAIQIISSTTILLSVETEDSNINPNQNGLWKVKIDGSRLTRLTIDNAGTQRLGGVSRDGSKYVMTSSSNSFNSLLFGSLNGGTPTAFVSVNDGSELSIVGWTTI